MNDISSNTRALSESKKPIGVGRAILVGQLVVNLPVYTIILSIFCVGIALDFLLWAMLPQFSGWAFLLGALISITFATAIGWLWWSFSVPRWRRWALQNGAPEDRLQKWGVITGLVWPKGWIFEKTEFKLKE
jgi:hypothetical protein